MQTVICDILRDYRLGRDIDLTAPACRPEPKLAEKLLDNLKILVFPGYFRRDSGCADLESYITMIAFQAACQLKALLVPVVEAQKTGEICQEFFRQLPRIRQAMQLDLEAFLAGDPAATGASEVITAYPGYQAIFTYRLAHSLYTLQVPVLPRMLTELAHSRTGIDIHPGAAIDHSFFIDHGTGVVIGQTAQLSHHVKLYQGVTLGALSTRKGRQLQGCKRHPTLESHVTVYAGATILGGETLIPEGTTIGANAFVTASIPRKEG